MNIIPGVPLYRPVVDIWYKYNSYKVLVFISMEGTSSTDPNQPYLSRYPENDYNISILPVV